MKKLSLAVLTLAMLVGCGASAKTGKVEKEIDSHGNKELIKVEVTVEGEDITALTIDETYEAQTTTKRTLGNDYGMKGVSAKNGKIVDGGEWFEQMDFLQNYIIENGLDAVVLDEKGYPTGDLTAGCTINITNYIAAVEEAIAAAE